MMLTGDGKIVKTGSYSDLPPPPPATASDLAGGMAPLHHTWSTRRGFMIRPHHVICVYASRLHHIRDKHVGRQGSGPNNRHSNMRLRLEASSYQRQTCSSSRSGPNRHSNMRLHLEDHIGSKVCLKRRGKLASTAPAPVLITYNIQATTTPCKLLQHQC